MATDQRQSSPVMETMQALQRTTGIPWHEIEQAFYEIRRENPGLGGDRFTRLAIERALSYWGNGVNCCAD